MFGLSNSEGNHGEDVKEYWFYLDSTPTHSYLKCLYKYPQRAFPYEDLVATNARRGKQDLEYELLDTGIFDDDRYFDVEVEYAKAGPDDILMLVTAHNRGPGRGDAARAADAVVPQHVVVGRRRGAAAVAAGPTARRRARRASRARRRGGSPPRSPPAAVLRERDQQRAAVRHPNASRRTRSAPGWCTARPTPSTRTRTGTKCAVHHVLEIPAGASAEIRVRLTGRARAAALGGDFDRVLATRREEADRFYATVIPPALDADARSVMRQALAGLLWSKQYYEYDVHRWLREHGVNPWDPTPAHLRNAAWFHMVAGDVISMPDKWEYPWFAAWDLAFHCAPLSLVDVDFAKEQVELLLRTRYLHPNGQIPAYEWNFGDVNPPVHRVGGAVRLRARGGDPRRGRPGVPRARLPAPADELHLVGEPQGPRRPQPVPGRLPRAGQHRHLRPLRAAARRRHARAGRRHGVDGPVLPVDAADGGRARARGRGLLRHRAEVRRALRVDRRSR